MHVKRNFHFVILALFSAVLLSGCSSAFIQEPKSVQTKAPAVSIDNSPRELSDEELIMEALSFLRKDEKEPNYHEANMRLEQLVLKYPNSKWAAGSQSLIDCLNKIASLQARLKTEKQKEQAVQTKLLKEIDGLKNNSRQVDEKYTAEITRLQQENEKLKNDLQQLKKLEVQLEKREKMLR